MKGKTMNKSKFLLNFIFICTILYSNRNIDLENAMLELKKNKINKEIYEEDSFEKNTSKSFIYDRNIIEASTQHIFQNYMYKLEKLRLEYKVKELDRYIEVLREKHIFFLEYSKKIQENKESFSEIQLEEINIFVENLILDKKKYEREKEIILYEKTKYYSVLEGDSESKSYLEVLKEQEKLISNIIKQEDEINKYKKISDKNREVIDIENKILKNKILKIKEDYLLNKKQLESKVEIAKLDIEKNKNLLTIKKNELDKKRTEWDLGLVSYKDYFEADIEYEKAKVNLYQLELQLELLQKELEL